MLGDKWYLLVICALHMAWLIFSLFDGSDLEVNKRHSVGCRCWHALGVGGFALSAGF